MLEVITPASSHDLTVLATVKREFGITTAEWDDVLAGLVAQASRAVASHCGRVFAKETVRETLRPEVPFRELTLARYPIASITSFVEDAATLTAADYELAPATGLLLRLAGDRPRDWCAGKIVVTYVAGYELLPELPEDVEKAAIITVRALWSARSRDPLIRGQETDVPGALRKRTDYWVGAIGEGGLPDDARSYLVPYLNPAIA